MNTLNENLPLFKNMNLQQKIIDTSNYENIKQKQKMPLSRLNVQSSKFLNITPALYIELCKSSSKKDISISPNPKNYSTQKLKENNNNIYEANNNMKCINVNEIENEDNEKNMMESLADREYELCLKNALKEALDENEKVRI
jgi:hypothetical protein